MILLWIAGGVFLLIIVGWCVEILFFSKTNPTDYYCESSRDYIEE